MCATGFRMRRHSTSRPFAFSQFCNRREQRNPDDEEDERSSANSHVTRLALQKLRESSVARQEIGRQIGSWLAVG